jgi:hypothetical protein
LDKIESILYDREVSKLMSIEMSATEREQQRCNLNAKSYPLTFIINHEHAQVMGSGGGDSVPETSYCTNCGEAISHEAKFCPECGAEQAGRGRRDTQPNTDSDNTKEPGVRHRLPGISRSNTTRRNVIAGVGYSFIGFTALGALGGDSEESSGSSGDEEQYPNAYVYNEDDGIVLRDVSGSTGQMSVEITGEATNESDQDYDYVQLQFGLYDSSDAKVGDALANTSGLPAGQVWRFTAFGTNAQSTSTFAFESMTAY